MPSTRSARSTRTRSRSASRSPSRSPRRKSATGKRKPSAWNLAVKKAYADLKRAGGAKWDNMPPTDRMQYAIARAKRSMGH